MEEETIVVSNSKDEILLSILQEMKKQNENTNKMIKELQDFRKEMNELKQKFDNVFIYDKNRGKHYINSTYFC